MSYAIGHLFYGVPITSALGRAVEKADLDFEEMNFTEFYTGADYVTGFLGLEVLEFDVCVDYHLFSDMGKEKKRITASAKKIVKQMVENFKTEYPDLAKILVDEGVEIDYYIVWS